MTSFSDEQITQVLQSDWNPNVRSAKWIGSGAWSDCFGFAYQGQDYVVRVGIHLDDFTKDHVATRFSSDGLRIPACSEPMALADGYHFCVSDYIEGIALERVTPWAQVAPDFVRLLESLRHIDTTMFSGWGMWDADLQASCGSWSEFLLDVAVDHPGRIHGWRAALDTNPTGAAAFEQGLERLRSIVIDDVPRSLVHNDLFNRNVHVHQGKINGVFDWGNSVIGDHLYDLANLCFWEPWLAGTRPDQVIAGLRMAWADDNYDCTNFDQRLQACMLHNGLAHIAYHASRHDWDQASAVADRIEAVRALSW